MKIDNQKILLGIIVLTLFVFPVVAFTSGAARACLGFLFVIFFPGYGLVSALFPKRADLGGVERIALSFGLSIAIVPIIGLALNYTPWGIRLYPVAVGIALFIVITSIVGWYRQRRLPVPDRSSVTLKASLPSWAGMGKLDKGLSVFMVVAIVVALGSLGYVVAKPEEGNRFTEFYILGAEGKAEDYPKQLLLGEPIDVVVGVANYEYVQASYRVVVTIDGNKCEELNIGTLAHKEKREERVSFIPQAVGAKQKVEFYLYKNGEDEPYYDDPLHLYIDVVMFYVLDARGEVVEYPLEVLEQGEPVKLRIGIINSEQKPAGYRVEIKTNDGVLYKKISFDELAYLENWEKRVSFIPWVQKEKQKIEFWLYKGDEAEPHLEVPLYVDIRVPVYPRSVVAKLPKDDKFTEFYILNTDGKDDAYPWQVELGEDVKVIVGIVNHEYEMATYSVEIRMGGVRVKEVSTRTLSHRDKWEEKVSFTPPIWGKEQQAVFWLYKNGQHEPYYGKPLFLYIDVN